MVTESLIASPEAQDPVTLPEIEARNAIMQEQIDRRVALRAFQERLGETIFDFAAEYDFKIGVKKMDTKMTNDLTSISEQRKTAIDQCVKNLLTAEKPDVKGFHVRPKITPIINFANEAERMI